MNISTIAMIGVGAVVGLGLFTMILPKNVHIERSAVIDATPEALYSLVASNKGYQEFNPYKNADPNLKIDLFGPEAGIGSGFAFDSKDGKGTQTVSAIEPNKSVTMAIDLGSMGKPTQKFTFDAKGGQTKVVWTMVADLGYNPIGRVFGLFMDGMIGKTLEQGLKNLSTVTSQQA